MPYTTRVNTAGQQNDESAPDGYCTQSSDTTYAVERRLVSAWREMPADDKARVLRECCQMVATLAMTGIRMRHPDASPRELFLRSAAQRLGPALMIEVYGWDPAGPCISR